MPFVSNPGPKRVACSKLRQKSPPLTSNTTAKATCRATSRSATLNHPGNVPRARVPPLRADSGAVHEARIAGASPKIATVTSESSAVNAAIREMAG